MKTPSIVLTWLWTTAFMPIFRRDWGRLFMKERLWDFLRGQTKAGLKLRPLVWPQKSFDPDAFSLSFSIKTLSLPLVVPPPLPARIHRFSSALSISGKAVGAKWGGRRAKGNKSHLTPPPPPHTNPQFFLHTAPRRGRSFLCAEQGLALTHWLFYLMWNSTRSPEPPQLLPQLLLSLFRSNNLSWRGFCFDFFFFFKLQDEVARVG